MTVPGLLSASQLTVKISKSNAEMPCVWAYTDLEAVHIIEIVSLL